MSEGDDPPPDEPVAAPLGALGAAPRPNPDGSGWRVNWWGLVPLAIVAALAFFGFRLLGVGADETVGAAVTSTTVRPPATERRRPTTTTTTSPTTTEPPATTRPAVTIGGPTVHAVGEVKPCRFGDACLAVHFTISGFAEPAPTTYLCIYPNSERQFSFSGTGKHEACLTGDEGDTVYVDVAGVRSGPVSATDLNP